MQLQKKYHKFYSNTIMALCLMLSLTYFGFCPQYSFGRYILVEVEKNEVTLPKSGSGKIDKNTSIDLETHVHRNISNPDCFKLDLHEAEKCLEKEGISDACLSFFKTGKGHERCKDWLEENHAMVMRLDTNLKKCVNTPVLDM